MYELDATKSGGGVFFYEVSKKPPKLLRKSLKYGPIKGRLIAFGLICGSALLKFFDQPLKFLVQKGWVNLSKQYGMISPQSLQMLFTWMLTIVGLYFFLTVIFFRKEKLLLSFDRINEEINLTHIPLGAKNPVKEQIIPFKHLTSIESKKGFGEYGYISINTKRPDEDPYKVIEFSILSEDQFNIFPENLRQITGLD